MSDRAYDRAIRKAEAEDRARLETAVQAIESRPDLRFLFARVFEACGMAASPFHPDPLTTAHACGKMAVGEELRALLETYSPALYYQIMMEHADAERQRNAALADKLAAD